MAGLKSFSFNFRLIDAAICLLLGLLLYFSGWEEFPSIKPMVMLAVFAIYFFDSDRKKITSWLLVFLATVFYLGFKQSAGAVPYSSFGVVQVGFTFWISTRLLTKAIDRRFWTVAGSLIFLASAVLSLGFLSIHQELYLFLLLSGGISFLPLLIEREELSGHQEIWRLCGFQQLVVRSFFLFWSIFYRYEIRALGIYQDTYLFFMAAMIFLPVFALVNWKSVKWDYLHESFITLLVMYGMIAGQGLSYLIITVLVLVGSTVTVNRMISSPAGGLHKSLRTLEGGGFGGFYFLLALAAAYAIHYPAQGVEFAVVASLVFGFAWAGAGGRKIGDEVVLPRERLWGRLVFQLASPLWLLWIFLGG